MTTDSLDKDKIRKRFGKNFSTYNQFAISQKEIAIFLFNLIQNYLEDTVENIYEIGSGTGFLTSAIVENISFKNMIINDISSESEKCISHIFSQNNISNWQFIAGDAEKIFPENKFNLITSSSTFQWFLNLRLFFQKVHSHLSEDGYLIFSTFGKNNYTEINKIFTIGLNYFSLEEIIEMLKFDFEILHFSENFIINEFNGLTEILKHIKYTGVNGISNFKLTKSKLLNFEKEYFEKFQSNGKLTLTYHPIFIVAKRKTI